MKGQLLAALGIIISTGSLVSAPAPAHAGTPLACGITQHDIANTLQVKNNTTFTFAKGKPVTWATSNGLTGSFLLQSALAPGQSAFTSISKNSSLSCTASVNTAILTPRH
jgi:hypothetical protein